MNTEQDLSLLLWGSLALVTLWQKNQLQKYGQALVNQAILTPADFAPFAIDLVAVAIVVFLAGTNDTIGRMLIAVGIALWLVYLMKPTGPLPNRELINKTVPGGH